MAPRCGLLRFVEVETFFRWRQESFFQSLVGFVGTDSILVLPVIVQNGGPLDGADSILADQTIANSSSTDERGLLNCSNQLFNILDKIKERVATDLSGDIRC